jgi:ABC-type multidrug transport system ATPase subunit
MSCLCFFKLHESRDPMNVRVPQPTSQAAISCCNIRFRFPDGKLGTTDLSLSIDQGELFCLLGANGAGKTTLIRQITGELTPEAGRILVMGLDVRNDAKAAKAQMGILPQSVGLFGALTVEQHLSSFVSLKGIRRSQRRESIGRIIEAFKLQPLLTQRCAHLSLGQQRWVLMALTLLGNPRVLILDEPTVGMDPVARRELWTILEKARKHGSTILLTTHYLDEAERLADRVGFLNSGRLGVCGTLSDLHAAVGKSVRVDIMNPDTGASMDRILFDTLVDAQRYVGESGLSHYSVGRITLDDIYLRLVAVDAVAGEATLPDLSTGVGS